MNRDIFVLDIETTSLLGSVLGGKVLEIGIARVSFDTGKVYPEYSQIVSQDLTNDEKACWCFQNTDLTPQDVESSPVGPVKAAMDLYLRYRDCLFTSYNVTFDFYKYLNNEPYNFRPFMAPDIMQLVSDDYNSGLYLKAQEAYTMFCGHDNPAGLPDGKERHRALDDAIAEGWILLRAYQDDDNIAIQYDDAIDNWRANRD